MKLPQSAKCTLGVTAAVALLAGCSSGSTSQFAPAAGSGATGAAKTPTVMRDGKAISLSVLNPKAVLHNAGKVLHTHAIRVKPAAGTKTLFISDSGSYEVQLYAYPSGSYIGQLAAPPEGFSEPQGECADKAGDVFIANTGASTIDEYDGAGNYMTTLSDPNYYPAGCSVDPSSGTLAVSNIEGFSGPGGISLYQNATGAPQQLTNPNMSEVFFLSYLGNTGKLYMSGFSNSDEAAYDSYINGNFNTVTLNGATIGFPGTVDYSSSIRRMIVGDQDTFTGPTFYHVKANGTVDGSTVTDCTNAYDECDVVQANVKGNKIVAPDSVSANAGIFSFPAGGTALNYATTNLVEPIGSAVGVAP